MRKTKIITTIGPATGSKEMMAGLIEAGANYFRFNLKHNTQEWHQDKITMARKMSEKIGKNIGIMIDIVRSDYPIEVKDYDLVALSYLKSENEVDNLRQRLEKKKIKAGIVAKIENRAALSRLEKIIPKSEAIMVARGDLGEDLPIEELGFFQKKIIDSCRKNHTSVIVATQMLQSMTVNPKPTRAEATDVSNAIFDGTDSIMLSDETAIGKNPVEAVKVMDKIARYCEESGELRQVEIEADDLGDSLVAGAVEIIKKIGKEEIGGVVVFTKSGKTAKIISSYRLAIPVIAISDSQSQLSQLGISYGIIPYYRVFKNSEFRQEDKVFEELVARKLLTKKKVTLVIHGNNWFEGGSAHNLSLVKIG
ncbi:MAG: pyruvate kinase [Candidatus Shapirobacteria bacterium]|jgi:pyruvate kinase